MNLFLTHDRALEEVRWGTTKHRDQKNVSLIMALCMYLNFCGFLCPQQSCNIEINSLNNRPTIFNVCGLVFQQSLCSHGIPFSFFFFSFFFKMSLRLKWHELFIFASNDWCSNNGQDKMLYDKHEFTCQAPWLPLWFVFGHPYTQFEND